MTTISNPQTQKATRPASRWRNRWLALRVFKTISSPLYRAGEEHWGTLIFPSRDVAETHAEHWMIENPGDCKYLGAFPVDA